MTPKIPATIVTGFLGAGKTTLIRHLLETTRDRRLALVINEFGDVGVDGEILRACGVDNCPDENIVELANGCLCCTVADDFAPAIEALLAHEMRPDHIIIETSGLALPKPLVKAFDWPAIRSRLTVDGVVAVVDGRAVAEGRFADDLDAIARERAEDRAVDHDNPLEEVFEDQLACADLVILNKTDLLSEAEEAGVLATLRAGAPRATKFFARDRAPSTRAFCLASPPPPRTISPTARRITMGWKITITTISTVSSSRSRPRRTPRRLSRGSRKWRREHDVLRIKGFVEISGKPMRLLVQGVGARFQHHFDRAWRPNEARASRLVVIGQKGLDRARVAQRLASS